MKFAFYTEGGANQIVLTPETDVEKYALDHLHADGIHLRVYKGEFYHCRGGWDRASGGDRSTIIVADKEAPPKDEQMISHPVFERRSPL